MNKKEIAEHINKILLDNENTVDFWNRHPVGIVIKKALIRRGNWKKRGNGLENAKLGYQVSKIKKDIRNGVKVEVPEHLKKYID